MHRMVSGIHDSLTHESLDQQEASMEVDADGQPVKTNLLKVFPYSLPRLLPLQLSLCAQLHVYVPVDVDVCVCVSPYLQMIWMA